MLGPSVRFSAYASFTAATLTVQQLPTTDCSHALQACLPVSHICTATNTVHVMSHVSVEHRGAVARTMPSLFLELAQDMLTSPPRPSSAPPTPRLRV